MARKRRKFGSSFKAKVALESVREMRTINELAKKHKLHPTQINLWKKQLLEGAELIFDGPSKPANDNADEPNVAELYEQIGRLKVELEWLRKKWPRTTLANIEIRGGLSQGICIRSRLSYWAWRVPELLRSRAKSSRAESPNALGSLPPKPTQTTVIFLS